MDIRLVRGRDSRVWMWVTLLAGAAIGLLVLAMLFGDGTGGPKRQVGAAANFGADRGEVLPMRRDDFDALLPLDTRELGRVVRLVAWAETPVRGDAVWVRTLTNRRVLVRFEPSPEAGALRRVTPGSRVDLDGYVQKISRAELRIWTDTLGVVLPRPKPGVKFGDLPDSSFARVDSLFIKDFYVSVRPEGISPKRAPAPAPAPRRDSVRPAGLRPADTAAAADSMP
ncbi:MAG TPA: hypothetical protein VFQ45_14805 [Longimicrobium sp.]|nr:hypothetical protein [Longimicrobium sp.]